MQENKLKISDHGVLKDVINGMNLVNPNPKLETLLTHIRKRWQDLKGNRICLKKKHKEWLQTENDVFTDIPVKQDTRGRPSIDNFNECSLRTKYRRTNSLQHGHSSNELLFAAKVSLKKENKLDEVHAVKRIFDNSNKISQQLSGNEALALLLDTNMTKDGYQLHRNAALRKNCELYPSYHIIKAAKLSCYPNEIEIDDFFAKISMQSLVDHTAQRLCQVQNEVIETVAGDTTIFATLRHKAGFDGSTGQSVYKQTVSKDGIRNIQIEESLFLTCIVPLDLSSFAGGKKTTLWRNLKPSSTLYCRPLRFQFEKESKDIIISEEAQLKEEIRNLNSTKIILNNGKVLQIKHMIEITMIDGKVHTVLSKATNSSQCCSICGCSPKEMNNIDACIVRNYQAKGLQYGLSTLHCWFQCFECFLHIGYKLPIKKWQARTAEDKAQVAETKTHIQQAFLQQMGLVVDQPKSGGSGTSNDGNTSRRAFTDAISFANITGVNKELILKLDIILSSISSGYEINTEKFTMMCTESAKLFVKLYPWYYMPQSLHKLLIHGPAIIYRISLPIGMMSEEAQEATKKIFKRFRKRHARKASRCMANEDILKRFLCSSDPVIASLRQTCTSKKKDFPVEVLELLLSGDNIVNL